MKSDLFGGVDKEEVQSASHVLVAIKDKQIVGFLLLEEPTKEIAEKYATEFNNNILLCLVLNGYAVRPDDQGKGISKMLLKEAKKIALMAGRKGFIGTIHPENLPSKKSIEYISKSIFFGNEFIHKTKDGRDLRRKRFLATF